MNVLSCQCKTNLTLNDYDLLERGLFEKITTYSGETSLLTLVGNFLLVFKFSNPQIRDV